MTLPSVCQRVQRALWRHGLQALPEEAQVHLATCAACQAVVGAYDAVRADAKHLLEMPLESAHEEALWRRLQPALDRHDRRERRGRWLRWWLGVPAALATAAAVAVWLSVSVMPEPGHGGRHAEILAAEGAVTITAAPLAPAVPASAGLPLTVASKVAAADDGHFVVQLGQDVVAGQANAELSVLALDANRTALALERGTIVVRVQRRTAGDDFTVKMPGVSVVVVGTLFEVAATAQGKAVTVAEGVVLLQFDGGRELTLRAGETWSEHEAVQVQAAAPSVLDALPRAFVTSPEPVVEANSQSLPPDDRVTASRGKSSSPTLRREPQRRSEQVAPKPDRDAIQTVETALSMGDCGDAARLASVLPQGDDAKRAEMLSQAAACYLSHRQVTEARALFSTVAERYARTPAGANATYELGRLALVNGERDQAKAAFLAYLAAAPQGVLAGQAKFRVCALEVERGAADPALQCLAELRRDHPGSDRVHESFFLEATVLRTLKQDCVGAKAAYARYLVQPGTYAKQAEAWSRWCDEH